MKKIYEKRENITKIKHPKFFVYYSDDHTQRVIFVDTLIYRDLSHICIFITLEWYFETCPQIFNFTQFDRVHSNSTARDLVLLALSNFEIVVKGVTFGSLRPDGKDTSFLTRSRASSVPFSSASCKELG